MFNFQHTKNYFHDILLSLLIQNYLNCYILNYHLKKLLLNIILIKMELKLIVLIFMFQNQIIQKLLELNSI